MIAPIPFSKFALAWLPAAALSVVVDPAPRLADAFAIDLGVVVLPPVTCALGALGIIVARPLVRKREGARGLPSFVLVSAILLIAVQLWIIDTRPSAFFAFVVAIGAGFAGFSLLELLADQVLDLVRRVFKSKGSEPESGA